MATDNKRPGWRRDYSAERDEFDRPEQGDVRTNMLPNLMLTPAQKGIVGLPATKQGPQPKTAKERELAQREAYLSGLDLIARGSPEQAGIGVQLLIASMRYGKKISDDELMGHGEDLRDKGPQYREPAEEVYRAVKKQTKSKVTKHEVSVALNMLQIEDPDWKGVQDWGFSPKVEPGAETETRTVPGDPTLWQTRHKIKMPEGWENLPPGVKALVESEFRRKHGWPEGSRFIDEETGIPKPRLTPDELAAADEDFEKRYGAYQREAVDPFLASLTPEQRASFEQYVESMPIAERQQPARRGPPAVDPNAVLPSSYTGGQIPGSTYQPGQPAIGEWHSPYPAPTPDTPYFDPNEVAGGGPGGWMATQPRPRDAGSTATGGGAQFGQPAVPTQAPVPTQEGGYPRPPIDARRALAGWGAPGPSGRELAPISARDMDLGESLYGEPGEQPIQYTDSGEMVVPQDPSASSRLIRGWGEEAAKQFPTDGSGDYIQDPGAQQPGGETERNEALLEGEQQSPVDAYKDSLLTAAAAKRGAAGAGRWQTPGAIQAAERASLAAIEGRQIAAQDYRQRTEAVLDKHKLAEDEYKTQLVTAQKRVDDALELRNEFKFDSNAAFPNLASKLAAALAVGIGAYAQGLSGGSLPNTALSVVNGFIDREFERQKAEYVKLGDNVSSATNLYANTRAIIGDKRGADQFAYLQLAKIAEKEWSAQIANLNEGAVKARALLDHAKFADTNMRNSQNLANNQANMFMQSYLRMQEADYKAELDAKAAAVGRPISPKDRIKLQDRMKTYQLTMSSVDKMESAFNLWNQEVGDWRQFLQPIAGTGIAAAAQSIMTGFGAGGTLPDRLITRAREFRALSEKMAFAAAAAEQSSKSISDADREAFQRSVSPNASDSDDLIQLKFATIRASALLDKGVAEANLDFDDTMAIRKKWATSFIGLTKRLERGHVQREEYQVQMRNILSAYVGYTSQVTGQDPMRSLGGTPDTGAVPAGGGGLMGGQTSSYMPSAPTRLAMQIAKR